MLGDAALAHDAAQEAFIAAYVNLGALREPAAFPGWFRRVVIKHSDRERRSRKTNQPLAEAVEFSAPHADPVSTLEASQEKSQIHTAIAELPPMQRQIVTLFYLRDHSQREIEEFMEMPVSTIKKNLFLARKKLKGRLETMIESQVQSNRPSQSGTFASEVQYLLALRTGDLDAVRSMVDQHPDLIESRFKVPITRERHYLPLGGTALHWAAVTGDEALLEFLLSRNVNLETGDRDGWKPLHTAVWTEQEAIAKRLIAAGVNVNASTDNGHSPLHFAAMRNYDGVAKILLEAGAQIDLTDKMNRTPMDWAALKGFQSTIELLLGRRAERWVARSKVEGSPGLAGLFLETGIKAIDLFAPLVRGGQVGILTPHTNVGSFVVLTELLLRMHTLHGCETICLGLGDENFTSRDMRLLIADAGIRPFVSLIFGNVDDSLERRRAILEEALTKANDLRRDGKEFLFLVLHHLALYEALVTEGLAGASIKDAATTTIYFGGETVGAEPAILTDLDSMITFDLHRARKSLYPAVDLINCRSRLLQEEQTTHAHQKIASEARRFLRRHQDLEPLIESRGIEPVPDNDHKIVERARRLDRFLTQPFYWTEPWTNLPGLHVPLRETLEGCRAILKGEGDGLPEEAFCFVGNLSTARVKAKQS